MTDSKEMIAFGNIVRTKILKYERLILLLVTLGLLIKSFHLPFSGLINTVLLSSVGMIYFFSAYSAQGQSNLSLLDIFIYKLCAFGSAVSIIGIMFSIQNWPSNKLMLQISLPTLPIAFIYILVKNSKSPDFKPFDIWLVVRIFVLILITSVLMVDK